jgi:hypothetical protein
MKMMKEKRNLLSLQESSCILIKLAEMPGISVALEGCLIGLKPCLRLV